MGKELDIDLFDQVKRKLREKNDPLAERLAEAVEKAYNSSGKMGVEKLFGEIREKYVEMNNESN